MFTDTINKVFTKLQFLFQASEQYQRISAFFKQSGFMILITVVLKKEE